MTSAWAQRQAELLRGCIVSPHVFASMVDRSSLDGVLAQAL